MVTRGRQWYEAVANETAVATAVMVLLLLAGVTRSAFGQQPTGRPTPTPLPSSRPAVPTGPPWWKDDQFKRDLGLTSDQSAKIDSIFQTTLPLLRQGYDALDHGENKLSRLIEMNAEEAIVTRQIDRVEATRSNLNKARTLMHLHMRQVLSPEQRVRFTALYQKRQSEQQLLQPVQKHLDE